MAAPLALLLQQANRVLTRYQSQHDAEPALHAFAGESVLLELTDLKLKLAVQVGPPIELVEPASIQHFSCSLRCTAAVLPQLKQADQLPTLIKSGELEVLGNLQVASAIANHLQHTQFDQEEWLSGYIGDVPAHLFCQGARKLHQWLTYRATQTQHDLLEWLQDEIRLLPIAAEQTLQQQKIQALSHDCEQLAERISNLQQTIKAHHEVD